MVKFLFHGLKTRGASNVLLDYVFEMTDEASPIDFKFRSNDTKEPSLVCYSLFETPASAKLAISCNIFSAPSTMFIARAAPVPSPKRIFMRRKG